MLLNSAAHIAFSVALPLLLLTGCSSGEKHPATETSQGSALTSFSEDITSPVHEFAVKTGETYTLPIKVTNTGTERWPAGKGNVFSVDAGYRWVDIQGTVLPIEGSRAMLTRSEVQPGQSDSLTLQVIAPPSPGTYTLWVSMVQEGVAWFFNKGAKPLSIQVMVD